MKTWFGFVLAFSLCYAQVTKPFQVHFEGHPLGAYTQEMAQEDFPPPASDYWYYGMEQGRASLVADGEGQALRVAYPAGCLGPNDDPLGCGMQIKWTLPESAKSLWISYRVKFEDGFDFRRGGKLPGLCGGKCYTGGITPQKGDGWSARLMWRPGGKVVQYMYFVDQAGTYGDDMPWNQGGSQRVFQPGTWHTVRSQIILNSIDAASGLGRKDGVLRSWFDGELALELDTLRLVDSEEQSIDRFYFSTFHGGDDSTWEPTVDSYARFDDIVIGSDSAGLAPVRSYRETAGKASVRPCGKGLCLDQGEANIRDLAGHNRGILKGGSRLELESGTYVWEQGREGGLLAIP